MRLPSPQNLTTSSSYYSNQKYREGYYTVDPWYLQAYGSKETPIDEKP
jgi:hypothetical protein